MTVLEAFGILEAAVLGRPFKEAYLASWLSIMRSAG
jgi:hypothetical protein